LHNTTNFFVAANGRIEFSVTCELGKICAVFFDGLIFCFGLGGIYFLCAAKRFERSENSLFGDFVLCEEFSRELILKKTEKKMLGADVLIAKTFARSAAR
jgi:hypothetical protein